MDKEKQFFCADANICAILAKCNSKNKWELWGLSEVLETGEAKYKSRLFSDEEYDDVEPINSTSGRTRIKVLKDGNWSEIGLIEQKKAANMPILPSWYIHSGKISYLHLSFDYEDENESMESLIERGALNNPTVLIDQIDAARLYSSPKRDERLLYVIDYLLKNGIDVNTKGEEGETALMAAACYCNTDIINLLLQNGAKVNDKNDYGGTAILNACDELNIEVVKLLLANGAEADFGCFIYIFETWDPTVDEMQIQLELSKLLLDRNIDINSKHGNGRTVLMYMAEAVNCNADYYNPTQLAKQTELIQFILDKGADINAQDGEGKTALMYAIEAKNKSLAEYLLEQGADANIKDKEGNTALMYAKHFGVRILGKLRKKMNFRKKI